MSFEDKPIKNMIAFIEAEAHEKASEIDQQAQEDYDIEKQRLVELDKTRVRADFDKKKKAAEVQLRVTRATNVSESRMKIMEQRTKILENVRDQTREKAQKLVKNDKEGYKKLMGDLLVQSLKAVHGDVEHMGVCKTAVLCRKQDEALVTSLINNLKKKDSDLYDGVTLAKGEAFELFHMTDEEAWGGIGVRSMDSKIMCNNTLSYRMNNVFTEQLPTVRYMLFN